MLFIMCNQYIFICVSQHNYLKNKKTESEKKMENKIIRECVQGLIDDSKMIDILCKQLETERINLVKVVADLDSNTSEHITLDMLKDLKSELDSATYKAEECRSQADYLKDEADECESAISECINMVDCWTDDMKQIKQEKEDAKQDAEYSVKEVTEEQKEIDNSNQYEPSK